MALILAIESSCDETAVAVLRGAKGEPTEVLASVISSQIELHREHGGVVPELASRNHSLHLRPLVEQALAEAEIAIGEVDALAATTGPGLASSLLIGSTAAKAMACALGKPFIGVNHLEGHLLSPFLLETEVPPHLGLIVSGGHTLLIDVKAAGEYQKLGSTRDDAAGEAFDKVGKMLGLPYPGGPEIEKVAKEGSSAAFDFPRSMLHDPHLDFSFSGLKTAVLYTLQKEQNPVVADLAASFQLAVIETLVGKTMKAARRSRAKIIALSGGVSMNRALRAAFQEACDRAGIRLAVAPPDLCTDNAAMIGFAGLLRFLDGASSRLDADISPNLPLV
ncbi:tRNA (adenosine(37)-N6)-threonylcarbamoyltransferase complex transferase subunit TsaD [Luteolibacter pohnpeiensis]|uniref:tRNA N6-adenosine threonylcarbamoyltransferase n=1 Tax=Luteolibacter pohnpeiensis TaxID=454153 RepID=A0A934S4P6_9BACT|nr:tRNA (adenosine(37)-N6)-threonylcarbamoyltransferase complex transferase subunit TsaD [Luteolibacter pohnpeiensis]MBK1881084.1 tRNA (adenosine(37)-N6)-threonylcarbamoyltransferase complex transferase subunit TsaD [Luteolibacter pohnpeiensis]